MKSKLLIVGVSLALVVVGGLSMASATAQPKYFVCKYTGTPGVNETLQTGQNPISVNGNALTPPIVIGGYFNDTHGRSLIVAQDNGQPEPTCATPQNRTPVPCPAGQHKIGTAQNGDDVCEPDVVTPPVTTPVTPPVETPAVVETFQGK